MKKIVQLNSKRRNLYLLTIHVEKKKNLITQQMSSFLIQNYHYTKHNRYSYMRTLHQYDYIVTRI